MKRPYAMILGALLALASLAQLCAGQTPSAKPVSKKSKTTSSATKSRNPYVEMTITELIAEDANRWSDKMATRVAVGGFVTQITKGEGDDTDIRVCENPKIEGMDRGRCIVAKCIGKLPCEAPQVGKPVTVKGITRYDAKVGAHWWEIQPVEEIEK